MSQETGRSEIVRPGATWRVFAFLRIIVAFMLLIAITGCAMVIDPDTKVAVFLGWGKIRYRHYTPVVLGEMPIGTEPVYLYEMPRCTAEVMLGCMPVGTLTTELDRDISTPEVISEMVGAGGVIASILALCL